MADQALRQGYLGDTGRMSSLTTTAPEQQRLFDQAREALPNFPEPVMTLWLEDCIRRGGWPPTRGREWDTSFCDQPVEYWRGLAWTLERIVLDRERLTLRSQFVLMMLERVLQGTKVVMGVTMPDSIARYESAKGYMRTEGAVPGVLVVRECDGYDILDGGHRTAAWIHLMQKGEAAPQFAWAWVAR